MRIAITGGTGFVGRNLARALAEEGHEIVLLARGRDRTDPAIRGAPGVRFVACGLDDPDRLAEAFAGCGAVAHCAGINLERGVATFDRVHVEGTRHVVDAAQRAGVGKLLLVSFLRARPDCGSPYHESKWAAEEIVRTSGIDYTIVKPGVVYGRGDHMLDHLSRALRTFPVFALVGFREKPIRPLAVADLVRVMRAALVEDRLSGKTVAVTGPEELPLGEAVRRVATVVGTHPLYVRLPVWMHHVLAWFLGRVMTIPLASRAQVRILSEGIVEPLPFADPLPKDLVPRIPFSDDSIRSGLPPPERFGLRDCRCVVAFRTMSAAGSGFLIEMET